MTLVGGGACGVVVDTLALRTGGLPRQFANWLAMTLVGGGACGVVVDTLALRTGGLPRQFANWLAMTRHRGADA